MHFFANFLAKKKFHSKNNYTTLIYRSRRFFWYITCPNTNFLIFQFLQTFFAKNSAKKNFHSKKKYTTLIYRSSRFEWRIARVSTNFCQFQGIGGRGGPISLTRKWPQKLLSGTLGWDSILSFSNCILPYIRRDDLWRLVGKFLEKNQICDVRVH